MAETDLILAVVKQAQAILHARGWQTRYSSGADSKLNIRSAISAACTQLATSDTQWHTAYRGAIATISAFLKDGVTSWEFGTHASAPRRRDEREVFAMFDKLVQRLESGEEKVRTDFGGGSNSITV